MGEDSARADYPLGTKRPELVRTPSGLPLSALTLAALREGRIHAADMRATPETLVRQADVARASGRPQLAENLERAAKLTAVPDDVILEIYTALRPGRSTAAELREWADRLEREYDAAGVAALVREASEVYADRDLVRRESR